MKSNLKKIGSLLVLGLFAGGAHAAAFTAGNVVVSQYGDGSTALSSAAAPVAVLEYLPSTASQASPVQTISLPSSGVGRLTGAGSTGTENYISRSTDGTILTFGGYDADAGTTSIGGTSAATVNRVVEKVDANGNFSRVVTGPSTMYNTANIRSTVSDGVNYWMAGSSGGEWYSANGGTPVQISATAPSNARVVRIYNGTLYVSSGSSPNIGINAFNGIPTGSTTSPTLIVAAGTSPYDFAINPAGTVVYIADSSAGIQKWVYSGGAWTKKFTFGTANGLTASALSMAVDFSSPNPVIYTTTGESQTNSLRKITDTSALTATSSTDMAMTLATAPANTAFKGVTFAPTTTPVILSQPADSLNNLIGSTFSLTVNTTTGGQTLAYQWYSPDLSTPLVDGSYQGGTISGSTTATLLFSSATIAQSGNYQVVITNLSGSITSRVAQVSVIANPVPPTIDSDISPTGSTNIVGDPVSFSVTAHGVPDVAYQWKWVPDTNTLVTNIIAGATSASLPLSNLTTNQSGKYFVTLTNSTAPYAVDSAQAVLKVNPSPALTVAQLRAMVDSSYNPTNTTAYYTIQGTVTTWTNLTTGTAPEFFVQDGTAGIMVYWANAGGSNCPPAGAVVKVTGPLTTFTGNLEIHPDYNSPITGPNGGVQVLGTGGALPAAQPLPFDPNITGSVATMKMLEGTYFVASNVTLLAGATFASTSGGESLTNNAYGIKTDGMNGLQFTNDAGQTFTLYVNSYTGIAGQSKPAGPVTVYGVLQEYYGAYEFTPTRYADIISYIHVTNVLTNARKGDVPTNSYTENVLRPGETQTTYISIADPAGGNVTLTPVTDGLPASASWTVLNNGAVGNAIFKFTPGSNDSGSNYLVSVSVSSTSGNFFNNTETVYVPTMDEQKMAITEFLANPTTNASAPYFNPLQRATDTMGVSTNDQYIEVANFSGNDLAAGWSLDYGNTSKLMLDSLAVGAGVSLPSYNSVVIYSGGSEPSGLITPNYASTLAGGLGLRTGSSTGLLILRNGNNGGGGSGNIIDRVAYSGSDESTNGSLTRFPTLNSAFVPQNYVSTNHVTPGAQYDGGSWAAAASVPQGVSPVSVSVSNNQAVLNFTAVTTKASTLWRADNLTDPFKVVNGGQFSSPSASFTETNLPNQRFYFITTQQ
jgi:hypothetical protein